MYGRKDASDIMGSLIGPLGEGVPSHALHKAVVAVNSYSSSYTYYTSFAILFLNPAHINKQV